MAGCAFSIRYRGVNAPLGRTRIHCVMTHQTECPAFGEQIDPCRIPFSFDFMAAHTTCGFDCGMCELTLYLLVAPKTELNTFRLYLRDAGRMVFLEIF